MNKKNTITPPFSEILVKMQGLSGIFSKISGSFVNFRSQSKIQIATHRQAMRSKLQISKISNQTLLIVVPFVLSLFHFIYQKYPGEGKYLFFEKNLPLFSIPKEKINWDTFLYFFQKDFEKNKEKIYWGDRYFLISNTKNNKTNNELVTYISSKHAPSWYYFPLIEEGIYKNFSEQNLDEIPLKLDGVNSSLEKNIHQYKFKKLSFTKKRTLQKASKIKQLEGNTKTPNNLVAVKRERKVLKPQSSPSTFSTPRKLLNQELRKLFVDLKLSPILKTNSRFVNTSITQQNLGGNLDSRILKNLLTRLDSIYLAKEIDTNRRMSGYRYPDMCTEEISFLAQRTQDARIKIVLPTSFLLAQNSVLINEPPKSFLIQRKNFSLKILPDYKFVYKGPGVCLNKFNGLDWEIVSKENFNLRVWLEQKLGSTNALVDSYTNFFGLFESPESMMKFQPKLEKNYWIENLPLFQRGNMANCTPSSLKFQRDFYLPFIEDRKNHPFSSIDLPLFEARLPKNTDLVFGKQVGTDFTFNSAVGLTDQFLFVPNTLNSCNEESIKMSFSSGLYKRQPLLDTNQWFNFFFDVWEPVTFDSWLVTAQLGFALLIFKVLKGLIDNYGRELLVYLLDLVAFLGFVDENLKQEIEILTGKKEKGFRIISKVSQNFTNIAGIKTILPEIVEMVWFLRNSGRKFPNSKTIPRGLLLTGPPGTGKTLLVQAIAGEAGVPVVALTGSSLLEPGESGAIKLEILFEEARQLAPCIVFIDEVDSLAEKREQIMYHPMGADEILENLENPALEVMKRPSTFTTELVTTNTLMKQQNLEREKLRILMQFLIELDGMKGREGVIVIGATNHPEVLDPAILRPGRFGRRLNLGLPGPKKREQILKLYSSPLGNTSTIAWDYLVKRTAGYSAADLASIMNQSTRYAILNGTKHTLETIEHGIDRITTIGFEIPIIKNKNHFSVFQLAYYQAGKVLISRLLEHHPPTVVTHLWPRKLNTRALQIHENLQNYYFRMARKIQAEHRVIGCYAGKAAEILFLQKSLFRGNLSDLGSEDFQFGHKLISLMIEKWYLFSKKHLKHQLTEIVSVSNAKEYEDRIQKETFCEEVIEELDRFLDVLSAFEEEQEKEKNEEEEENIPKEEQQYQFSANWQFTVSEEFLYATRGFANWYRLYLPDPDRTERNLEWIPPDEYYHGNSLINELPKSVNWNDIRNICVDYQTHSLILQSFNKAFSLLDQNRELLDTLTYELISNEILRENEIEVIFQNFRIKAKESSFLVESFLELEKEQIISRNWGENSRKPISRFIKLPDETMELVPVDSEEEIAESS